MADVDASYGTVILKDLMVPMRDGAHIVMDIHRPASEGPHPAILMRSYGRRFGNRNPLLIRDLVDVAIDMVREERLEQVAGILQAHMASR